MAFIGVGLNEAGFKCVFNAIESVKMSNLQVINICFNKLNIKGMN